MTAAAADDLYVDSTKILAKPTGAISISDTAANRVANLSSSNEAYSGSDPAWPVAAGAAGSIALAGEVARLVNFKKKREKHWPLLLESLLTRALRAVSLLSFSREFACANAY